MLTENVQEQIENNWLMLAKSTTRLMDPIRMIITLKEEGVLFIRLCTLLAQAN